MKKNLFILLAICISQLMVLNVSAQGSALGWKNATDIRGNVFVTGWFTTPTIAFGTTSLTNAASGSKDIYIVKYNAGGNVLWAKGAGGSNTDDVGDIATDGNGNVYMVGYFLSSTIKFGNITLTNPASGTYTGFIVKYDSSGNARWAKSAGTGAGSVVTDGIGNVYIRVTFTSSSITFGTITINNPAPGSSASCMVKYDPNGYVLWAALCAPGTFARDGNGNIYMTGSFSSPTITFGTTTLINSGAMGTSDIFIVKYDSSGTVLWATSAGGSANDSPSDIATDGNGNVYVTGSFHSSTITFGEITLTSTSTGLLPEDMFIVKYNPSSTALWAKSAGGISINRGSGIATDGSGNVYVTGTFANYPIIFGTKTLLNGGAWDMFIVKYDASGNVPWAKSAGGIYTERGFGIATDGSGNVFVTGDFQSYKITFGAIILTNTNGNPPPGPPNPPYGKMDMFIAKYDANGNVPWAKCAGGSKPGHPKSANDGINDAPANELTIYPNPTSGKFTVSTANSQSVISCISLFNMAGKEVLSQQSAACLPDRQVGSQQIEVDLSNQPKGLYIVLIKAGENLYKRKIIVE